MPCHIDYREQNRFKNERQKAYANNSAESKSEYCSRIEKNKHLDLLVWLVKLWKAHHLNVTAPMLTKNGKERGRKKGSLRYKRRDGKIERMHSIIEEFI